ncbi:hypothetical protein BH23VER1_BH23VER1_07130 [soil metagenome]
MNAVRSIIAALSVTLMLLSPLPAADTLVQRWEIRPIGSGGFYDFITSDDNAQRGIAYNPITDNLLVVSRTGSTGVYVLPASDADLLHQLNVDGVSGGFFDLNVIGIADDGVVYACSLALNSTSSTSGAKAFRIYRWADDGPFTVPSIAWEGDPAGEDEFGDSLNLQRWGDSIAVRGSGADTQIVVPTRGSTAVAVFTTTDGLEFDAPTILPNASHSNGTLGVAFGVGDTIYFKQGSQPLRLVEFDLDAGTSTVLQTFTNLRAEARPIGTDPASGRLGVLVTGGAVAEEFELYDISSPLIPPIFSDSEILADDNENLNATGAVAFGPDVAFVLSTNNGLAAYDIIDDNQTDPPTITTQPAGRSVIEGGQVEFSVAVSGTPPFTFEWFKDGDPIMDATGSTFSIAVVSADDAGDYQVTVTNDAGSVPSDLATLTVIPRVDSPLAERKWALGIDDRDYLSDGNLQRGLAVNPVNGNVLVASRAGGAQIPVLAGSNGAHLHTLDLNGVGGVAGETFPLNVVAAAADGAIYATNLSLSGNEFRIYRWADDQPFTQSAVIFDAAFDGRATADEQRLGDTITVRGAGLNTQILCATRQSNQVVIFTTTNGSTFVANPIVTPEITGSVGLGVAFGAGDTFWGKTGGGSLYRVAFNLGTGTGTVLNTFTTAQLPGSIAPIAVDVAANLLAGVSNENPDNVQIFDISNLSEPPVLLDQEFFVSDNPNQFGTGAIAFGPGCLVALGTNNGVLALEIQSDDQPGGGPTITGVQLVNGGAQIQFTLTGEDGATYRLEASTSMLNASWSELQTVTLTGTTSQVFTFAASLDQRFFRAVPLE